MNARRPPILLRKDSLPVPHVLTWQISDALVDAGYAARCVRCGRPVRGAEDWLTTPCVPRAEAREAS